MIERQFVNLQDLSTLTGLSYEGLRRLAVAGQIPAKKIGGRWIVSLTLLTIPIRATEGGSADG